MMSLFQKITLIILLGLALTACSERQGTISDPVPAGDNNDTTSSLQPAPTREVEEDDLQQGEVPVVEPSATETPETDAPLIRAQFEGLTFSYPAALIHTVAMEQAPVPDGAAAGSEIPQPVRVVLETAAAERPSTLTIYAVRQQNGLFYVGLPEVQQQDVVEIESLLQDGQPVEANSQPVQFVNGQGIRSVQVEGDAHYYAFEGMSNDGRFLVEFTYPVETDSNAAGQFEPALPLLDSIIATLYIDGSAESFNVAGCVDDAEYIANVTIPDGTEIAPGETFVKTWRMLNTGTCTWTKNYSWTFRGGDVLTVMDTTTLDLVSPGEEVEISVTLVAPETPGAYAGQWQLSAANQFESVGPEVYYLIVVPEV